MECELVWLAEIPDGVWQITAELIRDPALPARVVRHRCLNGAQASCSHVSWFGFGPYEVWPLKLLVGDPKTQLDELAAPAEPLARHQMARCAQELWRQQHRPDDTVDLVRILKRMGKSTGGLEEGHASATLVVRDRPGRGKASQCRHAFLHQVRALSGLESAIMDTLTSNLFERVRALERKLSSRPTGGRQIFMSDYVGAVRESGLAGHDATHNQVWRVALRRHAAAFAALPGEVRAYYGAQARSRQASERQKVLEDLEILRGTILLHTRRVFEEASTREVECKLDCVRFSAATRVLLQQRWQERRFTEDPSVMQHEDRMTKPAEPIPEKAREDLEALMPPRLDEVVNAPPAAWVDLVTTHRAEFRRQECAVRLGVQVVFKLHLIRLARPKMMSMSLLLPLEAPMAPLPLDPARRAELLQEHALAKRFDIDFTAAYTFTPRVLATPVEHVHVLPNVTFWQGRELRSYDEWMSLSEFIRTLPPPPQRRRRRGKRAGSEASSDSGSGSSSSSPEPPVVIEPVAGGAGPPPPVPAPQTPRLDDVPGDVEARMRALLEAKRAAWVDRPAGPVARDFHHTIGSVDWSAAVNAADLPAAALATPVNQAVRNWLKQFGWQQSFSVALSHGEETCQMLCDAWCHKMQWALDRQRTSADPTFSFSDEVLGEYPEPFEFSVWVSELRAEDPLWLRVTQIRDLLPKFPSGRGPT
jgi:hypothetical protein